MRMIHVQEYCMWLIIMYHRGKNNGHGVMVILVKHGIVI